MVLFIINAVARWLTACDCRGGRNELGNYSFDTASFIGLYGVRYQVAIQYFNAISTLAINTPATDYDAAFARHALAIGALCGTTVHDTACHASAIIVGVEWRERRTIRIAIRASEFGE